MWLHGCRYQNHFMGRWTDEHKCKRGGHYRSGSGDRADHPIGGNRGGNDHAAGDEGPGERNDADPEPDAFLRGNDGSKNHFRLLVEIYHGDMQQQRAPDESQTDAAPAPEIEEGTLADIKGNPDRPGKHRR